MEQRITMIAWIATFGSMPTPNYTAPDYADIPARTLLSLQFQSGWMVVAATDSTRETRTGMLSFCDFFFFFSSPLFFSRHSPSLTRLPFRGAQSSTDFKAIFRGDRRCSSIKYSRLVVSRKVTSLARRGFRECIWKGFIYIGEETIENLSSNGSIVSSTFSSRGALSLELASIEVNFQLFSKKFFPSRVRQFDSRNLFLDVQRPRTTALLSSITRWDDVSRRRAWNKDARLFL